MKERNCIMTLIRYQKPEVAWSLPFSRVSTLRDEMDQLFDRIFQPSLDLTRETQLMDGWTPVLDLYEDKDSLIVKAEIPGMKKEDINITLHGDTLSISGERKFETRTDTTGTYRAERFEGRFHRTFSLPISVNAEKITASYSDGVLTIALPKAEEAKPKQIPVSVK